MIHALSRSLSLRLLGIFIITSILVISVLIILFSQGLGGQWRRTIQPHLVQYVHYVQEDLGHPPSPDRAQVLAERLPVNIFIYKDSKFLFSTNGRPLLLDELKFSNINRNMQTQLSNAGGKGQLGNNLQASISHNGEPSERILRIEQNDYTVYYDLHGTRYRDSRRDRHGDELLFALVSIALVLGGSYWLIRRQLSPIRQIQCSVGRMSHGELDHRVDRRGHSDLDELGNSIDAMAERIQAMLDAKRQLLMGISHELRSPLARARVAAQLLPESVNRDRLEEDLKEMQRMVSDIMESEQLQANHSVLNVVSFDVVELFNSELQRLDAGLTLQTNRIDCTNNQGSSDDDVANFPLVMEGDPIRLRILLRNLVSNALQHGKGNGQNNAHVRIRLTHTPETVYLCVSDEGSGIEAEHLATITDPFYRPDASRTRSTGGFGLGLTLARLIAEAHGGTLLVESEPSVKPGTRVTVTLPRYHR